MQKKQVHCPRFHPAVPLKAQKKLRAAAESFVPATGPPPPNAPSSGRGGHGRGRGRDRGRKTEKEPGSEEDLDQEDAELEAKLSEEGAEKPDKDRSTKTAAEVIAGKTPNSDKMSSWNCRSTRSHSRCPFGPLGFSLSHRPLRYQNCSRFFNYSFFPCLLVLIVLMTCVLVH